MECLPGKPQHRVGDPNRVAMCLKRVNGEENKHGSAHDTGAFISVTCESSLPQRQSYMRAY